MPGWIGALAGAKDEADLMTRAAPSRSVAIDGLLTRKGRFDGLGAFEDAHIRIDADDFTLDGFDVAPGRKSKPLVMTFKKPDEVVGNHIAKYQSVKLAKMLMAYDFDREMNPFVELGGFLFTFIGDGAPGTGKTTLIQMIAGLVNGYCQVAGYPSTTRISASTRFRPIRASRARTAGSSSTMCSTRAPSASARSTTSTRWRRSAPTTAPRPASRRSPAC